VSTLGWLFIFAAIFLARAVFKGQVLDDAGKFILPDILQQYMVAFISNDTAKLKELEAMTSTSGLLEEGPIPPTPDESSVTVEGGGSENSTSGGTAGGATATPKSWATNPRSTAQALAWSQGQVTRKTGGWYFRCLAFCAHAYGLPGAGTALAGQLWGQIPSDMHHTSGPPPPGAILHYKPNHVALAINDRECFSTDVKGRGHVYRVPLSALTSGPWHLKYVGWTPPYFPKAGRSHRT